MKWIPTKERLPEHEEVVLVTIREGCEFDGSIALVNCVEQAIFYHEEEDWCPYFMLTAFRQDNKLTNEVIAWMPMPEAYDPEEEQCANE